MASLRKSGRRNLNQERNASGRVQYLIGSAHVGGTERQLVRLCLEVRARGWHPSVLFFRAEGPLLEDLEANSIPWSDLGFTGLTMSRYWGIPSRNSVRSIAKVAGSHLRRHGRIDVYHDLLDGSVALGPLLQRRDPKSAVVAGVRGNRTLQEGWMQRLFARNLKRSHAVICNSPELQREISSGWGVPVQEIHMIPNGVDVPAWSADPGHHPPTSVTVSNFHSYKGHRTLLDALALIDLPLQVRLCGTGSERESMRRHARRIGVGDQVVFVPDPADIGAELKRAQMAIHPSETEGMSNAILEQMAAGLPIIAAHVGGNPLLVKDGVNGLLVRPDDPLDLASAIRRVAQDPNLRVRMGNESRVMSTRFDWNNCAASHIAVYDALLGRWPNL